MVEVSLGRVGFELYSYELLRMLMDNCSPSLFFCSPKISRFPKLFPFYGDPY